MTAMTAPSQTRPKPPKAGARSRRLTRGQLIGIGAVVVVLAGGGLGAVLLTGGDDAPKDTPALAAPTKDDAQNVADALSKLASRPQDLVASDVGSAVLAQARKAVPKNATVTADPASWHADGLGGGTITVTVKIPGGATTVYTAMMIKERSGWKVVGTIPMTKPPAGQQPATDGAAPVPNVPTPPAPKTPPPAPPALPGTNSEATVAPR
jgi:hypothetical protein